MHKTGRTDDSVEITSSEYASELSGYVENCLRMLLEQTFSRSALERSIRNLVSLRNESRPLYF